MNGVFIVPTGQGAEIGGHSGDATPAAKMIAGLCDNLIIHPNVVNASDINEMSENMLYVEGYTLDRFLEGAWGLKKSRGNSILVVTNAPLENETVNAVSAARATIGADIKILVLDKPLLMWAELDSSGVPQGIIENLQSTIDELEQHTAPGIFVIHTPITTKDKEVKDYLENDGGANIWGRVEAELSKKLSHALGIQVIHAPVESSEVFKNFNEIVDPRKAAEIVSIAYLHCCLKGAHGAPVIEEDSIKADLWYSDIDFMISPAGLYGRPHIDCKEQNIPVIYVKENKILKKSNDYPNTAFEVENYLEAAGVIAAMKAGVTVESVTRPLRKTIIYKQ